jgi:hypothetical protein
MEKEQFFNELMEKDYGAYHNFPYTYPSFTMIGLFQRLFKIKSKYYKEYKKNVQPNAF